MKVILTGTISTGKSTLAGALCGIARLGIVPEIARELLLQNPALEKKEAFQDILFLEQTKREKTAVSNNDIVVCDRGVLDNIVHSRYYGHKIKPEWEQWLPSYEKIFLLNKDDVMFDLSLYPTGFNWIKFREDLHRITLETLVKYGFAYSLLSGTVENRKNDLLEQMGIGKERK